MSSDILKVEKCSENGGESERVAGQGLPPTGWSGWACSGASPLKTPEKGVPGRGLHRGPLKIRKGA